MDYSIDFIANDGKLTCGKPGQEIEDYILSRIETYLDHQEDIFLQWMSIMRMTCTTLRHNFFHLITFMEQMAVVYMEKLVKYTRKTSIIHKSITWIKQDMIHFMVHH